MERTQIYLEEAQKKQLAALAAQKGKSLAEVIREAVDIYIIDNKTKFDDFIQKTIGLWADRDDVDPQEYPDALRGDLNKRLEDIYK